MSKWRLGQRWAVLFLLMATVLMLTACQATPEVVVPESVPDAAEPEVATPTDVPRGEMVPVLDVSQLTFPSYEEWWRQMPGELAKAGIRVNVRPIEANAWIEQCIGQHNCGTFTSTGSGITDDRIDPNWFLNEVLHSRRAEPGGNNLSQWRNAEVDALVEAQAAELDPQRRREIVMEIQEIFARESPFIPVYFINDVQAYNKDKFEGFLPRPSAGISRPNNFTSFLNIRPLTSDTLLRLENNHDGNSTNPFVASGGVFNTATILWIYDTLTRMDENLEVIPWAGESWQWLDNTTLELTLRRDMAFHDGQPVTADDVVFTYDYARRHNFASWRPILDLVEDVRKVNDHTVQFQLPIPFAPFEANVLTAFFIVPQHIWQDVADPETFQNQEAIGSGPFTFGHWRRNESWLFERNANHFHPPQVDVIWAVIPSPETWLGQFETQQLDANGTYIRGDVQIDTVAAMPHMETVVVPGIGVQSIYIDTTQLPGCDPVFRRAVHHLTPKAQLLDVVAGKGGGATGSATWFHPESAWYNSNIPSYPYDPEQARAVLAEAGYSWDSAGQLYYPPGLNCP
jgi:peptide/nickel transport system substrate-binding protein